MPCGWLSPNLVNDATLLHRRKTPGLSASVYLGCGPRADTLYNDAPAPKHIKRGKNFRQFDISGGTLRPGATISPVLSHILPLTAVTYRQAHPAISTRKYAAILDAGNLLSDAAATLFRRWRKPRYGCRVPVLLSLTLPVLIKEDVRRSAYVLSVMP